jgi:hypothetical protein
MIGLTSRRAALVLVGSALALAGNILPAQAATTGWRVEATFAARGSVTALTSVAAVSPSDAWATGFNFKVSGNPKPPWQTVIRHWTGKTWRSVTLPAKIAREWARQLPVSSVVGAMSARDVWVFGGFQAGYLRLHGSRWSLGQLPGASKKSGALVQIDAVKVFSRSDVWAFGLRGQSTPYVAHYIGRKWVRVTVPGSASGGGAIDAVAAVSPDDMWAVEYGDRGFARSTTAVPVVLHWTASSGWHDAVEQPPLTVGDELTSVVAEPGGDVWFGGSAENKAKGTRPLTAEWNGNNWSVSDLPVRSSSADWRLLAMTPDGTGGIWAVALDDTTGTDRIWHLHGTSRSPVSPAFGKHPWDISALALVPGTHSVWAVGAVLAAKSSADGLIAVDGPLPR